LGYNPKHYKVVDGSGLSLYNYTTPELMVGFLRYAYSDASIFDALCASLPIAAMDGTLKKRMKGTPAALNVRAKTGSVTAISTLSGYLMAPNKHVLCFAIFNQGLIRAAHGRDFQDRVCTALTSAVSSEIHVVNSETPTDSAKNCDNF
jgi:D-alanyl-D-alanine carboxypeptidase/D-alanyl-D-alanine-endopeptidase (penicillin-binding protein 4)